MFAGSPYLFEPTHGVSVACVSCKLRHKQGNLRISPRYVQLALKTTRDLSKCLFKFHLRNLHIELVNYSISS
jgi:hypothetical protein